MKPNSIKLFDRFYLGALALGLANTVIHWDADAAALEAAESGVPLGSGFFILTTAAGFIISLLLWYFVSQRASNIARWLLTVLFGLGLVGFLAGAAMAATMIGEAPMLLGVLGLSLEAVAVWMLFRPDAKAWFGGRGQEADIFR